MPRSTAALAAFAIVVASANLSGQDPPQKRDFKRKDIPSQVREFFQNTEARGRVRWAIEFDTGDLTASGSFNSTWQGGGDVAPRYSMGSGGWWSDSRAQQRITFCSLRTWFAPTDQVIELISFANGESLLVRYAVVSPTEIKGDVIGVVRDTNIRASFTATMRGEEAWLIDVSSTGGATAQGQLERFIE